MRFRWGFAAVGLSLALIVSACGHEETVSVSDGGWDAKREQIDQATRKLIQAHDLGAVIVQVSDHGNRVMTRAYGESFTGVPATPDMHFRNGAVALEYMSTLLLRLVDLGRVGLDDPVSKWLPNLPRANAVTLRMLAAMTSGYPDYVNDTLAAGLYANPFRHWSQQELLDIAFKQPVHYAPGTNWSYAHTNYVVLGMILRQVTGQPLDVALRKHVLEPLGLRDTVDPGTPEITPPVLHAFTSERRSTLGIPVGTRFLEESTYWNPSWTLAKGAIQTSNIADLTRTAIGLGEGRLLSRRSYEIQIDPHLGFGHPQPGCPTCTQLDKTFGFGLGVVRNGGWVLQRPSFGGYSAVAAYNPTTKISVAVTATFREGSFTPDGDIKNFSEDLYAAIGAIASPSSPPLVPS